MATETPSCDHLLGFLFVALLPVVATPHDCFHALETKRQEESCRNLSSLNETPRGSGCAAMWDNITCWSPAPVGEIVNISCNDVVPFFQTTEGVVSRVCTPRGWSHLIPTYNVACVPDEFDEGLSFHYTLMQLLYTVGYSTSLASLFLAMIILCMFRKLHCTRNYIHMHLFFSYMLRAISVFVKDALLFPSDDPDECITLLVWCKMAMVFMHYSLMANFSWLLVEGLYLHTLLLVAFFDERRYFWCYVLLGWGAPVLFITTWTAARWLSENVGCWEIHGNAYIWYIMKGPILLSISVNFVLFISIIRVLVLKLRSPDGAQKDNRHYKRLAKSTLLLIPLFGAHYIIFAFFPDELNDVAMNVRMYFELALGSFQGFVVAVLYCFLNGEVQTELKKRWLYWRSCHQQVKHSQVARNSCCSEGVNGLTQLSIIGKESPKGSPKDMQIPNFQDDSVYI